jgi:NADPH-dependent 2,4-dienoyl-CoA reductase/sulfur reductase-like enzyme
MHRARAVIIGAGPAGLGAAVELARRGIEPLLLDENPMPGGQIYKQPTAGVDAAALSLPLESTRLGQTLLEDVAALQTSIRHLSAASVSGIFENLLITYTTGGALQSVYADTLLLALGAYDRVVPFPGWDTPGVITVGGLQSLLKHHGILPGGRVVLAGSGLLMLLVAAQMTSAGYPPVAVVEATGWSDLLSTLPGLVQKPSMLREGFYLLRILRRGGVRFLRRRAVVSALGNPQVTSVEVAPVDRNWHPDRSRSESIHADCLAVGFGLTPEVSLPRLIGAEFEHRPELGGWVPRYNGEMETTCDGVFVAGDGCGVRGAEIAQLQGRLAGIAMAERLGVAQGHEKAEKRRLQESIEHRSRVRQGLENIFRIRPGIYDSIEDDTVVCRCEEITWREMQAWLARGINSATQLKMATRVGMGRCQGRFCAPNLPDMLVRELGDQADLSGSLTVRPPTKPVSLAALAEMAED